MDAFIARQPIFDRQQDVFGYELLFRSGAENFFRPVDGDLATASLIDDAVHLHSVDKLTNGRTCFINFTRNALVDGLYSVLSPASTVVEVLETVELDDELLEACRKLRSLGYRLALDDYIVDPRFEPLLSLINLLKVEFPVLSLEQHHTVLASARTHGYQLLAEKVETPEQYELAMELGYHYFQGYFFCKPQIQSTRRIPKSQMQCLRLLQKVSEPEFDVDEVEKLLRSDLALSYKLLRYLNSPLFQRTHPLRSVRHAIITLGQQPLRQWVSLMAVEELSREKPLELIRTSLTRARFCERLGAVLVGIQQTSDCFLLGMFSLLDAILDQPMSDLTRELNLEESLQLALEGGDSPLRPLLDLAVALEVADWERIGLLTARLGITVEEIVDLNLEAIAWSGSQQLIPEEP